ncbi:thiopurine S-methyltransferase [Rhipicephalus sanguineus]|uniref:thiopurine S-methyltransferase n=1 Tax=Rhipicephalus sanguineus TaxID=34632 RepID=UPI0020C2990D|nr:thiopurine S-methyltransferase [Rhipicephalus sanguineus]
MDDASQRETSEYWRILYKEERSAWTQKGVTKLLLKNKETIIAGKTNARVFIPLCGKAHELKWFYDLGHRVVGVEFVEEAVRSYFTENDLPIEEATCPIIKCKILKTPDERLQVFICNIFDFKRECAGSFGIVWDRSGFAVMRLKDRARYAAVIKNLLAADFSYGMWTKVYDSRGMALDELEGPVSAGEFALQEHFGDVVAKVVLVDSQVAQTAHFAPGRGPFTICLWHMTPELS